MKRIFSAVVIGLFMIGSTASADLMITPGGETYSGADCDPYAPSGDCGPGASKILTWLDSNVPDFSDLEELYKNDVDSGESGGFATVFETTFSNTPTDPADALISYVGGGDLPGSMNWLLVKDGTAAPVWYLFDISNWDAVVENLSLKNFWIEQGGISHVAIYGVPEPSVLALFGLGLVGLGVANRRRRVS